MIPNPLLKLIALAWFTIGLTTDVVFAEPSKFQQAQERYKQADWQAALGLFLPTDQTADLAEQAASHFYAAECLMQLSRYEDAQARYQTLLAISQGKNFHARAQFRRGEAYLLSGNAIDAERILRDFIDTYPQDALCASAYNRLAELAMQANDLEQAISSFNYVIENCSTGSQVDHARLGLARTLLAANRLAEVPIALGRLCHSTDGTIKADALFILGRARYEAGQFDQALATFRRIYELQIDSAPLTRARLAAGWALWKLSRCDEIGSEIAALNVEQQNSAEYHYLLGMANYSNKDWTKAAKELSEAASPESVHRAAALFYLGESSLRQRNFKEARRAFQQLVEEQPNDEWADDGVWGLARTARATDSKSDLKLACELLKSRYPQSDYVAHIPMLSAGGNFQPSESIVGIVIFEEAVGHERDGHFDAALAAYHAFLGQPDRNGWLAEGLWRTARLHERLKQNAEAAKFYERLLQEFPEFDRAPNVTASLAWMAAERGNNATAEKHCQKLVAKFPQSPQAEKAAYWLALAAADEKRSDAAQSNIDWLLSRQSESHEGTSEHQQIWQQTLCLQCQLLAENNKWQSIVDLLDDATDQWAHGKNAARLEFWRAEAALRLDDYAGARQRFDSLDTQCVGIFEPWVPMVSLRRAQLAARREDWQEVLSLIEELDDQHPEFELAYECDYLRGRALAGRGEMSAARAAYGQVLANEWATGTETAAMAQWMVGETYFHQRSYELAATAYERVIERHTLPEWQARAALQAGKCNELMEKWEAAAAVYSEAADRWQGTTSAKQLSARLRWTQEHLAQQEAALRR